MLNEEKKRAQRNHTAEFKAETVREGGRGVAQLAQELGRAGIVVGYTNKGRRKGCGFTETVTESSRRPCPLCQFKLWPKAHPKPLRFHDLRGTTGTLLARAGVSLVVAQRILRHRDPRLTANIYSRVDLDDLRAGIARLGVPSMATIMSPAVEGSEDQQGFVATLSPVENSAKNKAPGTAAFARDSEGFKWSGRQDSNLRPLGPEPSALPG